jgi:hypothetical protein
VNNDTCKTGAGCQSELCASNGTCVSVAVSGTKCASPTSCGAILICTEGFCQAPGGLSCTSADACQSGICSGSGLGSTCVVGTAKVGALCTMSTTGCNCLSGVCEAFPLSTTAIIIISVLGSLVLALIGVAVWLKK